MTLAVTHSGDPHDSDPRRYLACSSTACAPPRTHFPPLAAHDFWPPERRSRTTVTAAVKDQLRALAGRAGLPDGGTVPSRRPPRGLPHGRPWAAALHGRPLVCVEGLPTDDRAVGLRQVDGMALGTQLTCSGRADREAVVCDEPDAVNSRVRVAQTATAVTARIAFSSPISAADGVTG